MLKFTDFTHMWHRGIVSPIERLGLWFEISNKQVIGYESITTEIGTVEKKQTNKQK